MSAQPNSALPVVLRSAVPSKTRYQDYREELRLDFWYSCAYCTITEMEASGVSFEIDHYEPQKWFPALAHIYDNLMWCCRLCNGQKKEEYPTDAMRAAGLRFYRPDRDDPDEHFEIVNIKDLRPKSRAGEYSIEVIRLNRQQLKKLRERRHRHYTSQQITLRGTQALRRMGIDRFPSHLRLEVLELVNQLEDQVRELDDLLRQLNRSPNLDREAKESKKIRREYLNKQKAIFS